MPVPVPTEAPVENALGAPDRATHGVIFINFDGAYLSDGWDDATQDVTQISECAGDFAPYGDGPMREAVVQAVRGDWSDFGMTITDQRPATGPYTMNMTGPSNPFGGGVIGIAPLDCDDEQTHSNITYAFHSANDGFSAAEQATTISQEVAHSYGLEHVDEPGDIMNPYNAGGDAIFIDTCIAVVQGGSCPSQHQAECGSGYSQNSYRELLTLFGPSSPDGAAPSVAITFPLDGQEFAADASFAVMVDAADDQALSGVTLYKDGAEVGSDASEPYAWQLEALPSGVYELYAVAVDLAGNEAHSETITIGVDHAVPDPEPETSGADGDAESDGGASDHGEASGDAGEGDEGGSSDPALPPGFGLDGEPSGCGCAGGLAQSPAALWVLLGWRRRRRAWASRSRRLASAR